MFVQKDAVIHEFWEGTLKNIKKQNKIPVVFRKLEPSPKRCHIYLHSLRSNVKK